MSKFIKRKLGSRKKLIIGMTVAFLGISGLAMENDKEIKSEQSKIELSKEDTKKDKTEKPIEETKIIEQETEVTLPKYEVAKIDNTNLGPIIRETLHIVVEGEYNSDQLYKIAEKEIKSYTATHKVNALTVGFYESKEKIGKGYEMGRVEYVPNGVFGDAVNVKAGNYSTFKFVNLIQEKLKLPPKEVKTGTTDLEEVKKDFENRGYENTTEITREGNTLKIVVNEVNDLPWEMPGEFSIETYTDFCMENIRTDIETLDLTVKQPSNKVRAVLDMSKTKDQGFGRYFEEDYIIENLK